MAITLISQDGLKAIGYDKIQFFVIPKDRNERGNFNLLAKTPNVEGNNFYEYLILFEHENLAVVNQVMCFLAAGKIFVPYDDDEKNLLFVDLPELYKHGMAKIYSD